MVGQSVSKDNNFESFCLTLRLVKRHFQKEPDFFFVRGRGVEGGGYIIYYIIYYLYQITWNLSIIFHHQT